MPCEWLKMPDGSVAHVHRGHSRPRRRRCRFCGNDYYGGKLCDFPTGSGTTCDAEMCDGCARTLGRGEVEIGGGIKRLNDTIDVCPDHRNKAVVKNGKIEAEQASLFEDAR